MQQMLLSDSLSRIAKSDALIEEYNKVKKYNCLAICSVDGTNVACIAIVNWIIYSVQIYFTIKCTSYFVDQYYILSCSKIKNRYSVNINHRSMLCIR